MSSIYRSPGRAVSIAAAIVIALLFVFRPWTPAPVTMSNAIEEPSGIDASTSGDAPPLFADAEIELSIADVCAAAERAATSAPITYSAEATNTQIAEYKDAIRRVKERLIVSLDAEHLHLAAILETDPVNRIELITKALVSGWNDAFLVWDAVRICAEAREQTSCPMHVWQDRLLALDGQNSEAWVRTAANRLLAGDNEAALRALQRAASAPESRVYWSESVEMIERGFAAASDYAFAERAAYGFGIAGSNQPDYLVYVSMCNVESAKSQEWAYACLAYGELVERQGRTDMGQSIARAIQERALQSLEDDERLAAVVARRELARRKRLESSNARHALSDAIMISNPTFFSRYLTAIRSQGEITAKAYLREETDRWLRQHKDLECIP